MFQGLRLSGLGLRDVWLVGSVGSNEMSFIAQPYCTTVA